jgi:nucleoid-associated protein YgaU
MAKASQKASESKLSENIGSIILGFVVVLILGGFLLNVFRNNNKQGKVGDTGETTEEQDQTTAEGTHVVQQGETLWSIAENETGSGYNWQAIADANNLENENDIEEGMTLVIPDISSPTIAQVLEPTVTEVLSPIVTLEPTQIVTEPTVIEIQEEKGTTIQPKSGTYTVQRGDSLWKIAVAQYNDGYQWVKIAQANNLTNPDIIHAGNVLVLP